MTKDGRSPVKADSMKKSLNVTPLRPAERKKRLVDELIDEAPPAIAGYERNWMTSLRNGDGCTSTRWAPRFGQRDVRGRRGRAERPAVDVVGAQRRRRLAAELALVLDKTPLSAFVRDAKDGTWKEIADTLRLQSEQHVMVSHGEPTVRAGTPRKSPRLKSPPAPGDVRQKDFNELLGDYKARTSAGCTGRSAGRSRSSTSIPRRPFPTRAPRTRTFIRRGQDGGCGARGHRRHQDEQAPRGPPASGGDAAGELPQERGRGHGDDDDVHGAGPGDQVPALEGPEGQDMGPGILTIRS